jgi:hypothetical protein
METCGDFESELFCPCGIFMTVSRKYIIFKRKNDTGIGDCSGSGGMEDFQEDEIVAKIQAILSRQKRKPQKKQAAAGREQT